MAAKVRVFKDRVGMYRDKRCHPESWTLKRNRTFILCHP